MPQNVIVIAGPTASGKSQLAIDLALKFDGVVVNADASQIYKSIPILAACPSLEDYQSVEHRLYEYVDDEINGNVVLWLDDVAKVINEIWSKGKIPIVVGGGGMYLDNLINGTTPIPPIDEKIRLEILEFLENNGVEKLYEILQKEDLEAAQTLNPNDTTRVRRALEILRSTKKSVTQWYKEPMIKKIEANFLSIKLMPSKKDLDTRCDLRLEMMFEAGAIDEVKNLLAKNLNPDLPVMKAKGVPEICDLINGKISLTEALETSKIRTRQYAKRQLTWFRNKLDANICFDDFYKGQKEWINTVEKQYKLLHKK